MILFSFFFHTPQQLTTMTSKIPSLQLCMSIRLPPSTYLIHKSCTILIALPLFSSPHYMARRSGLLTWHFDRRKKFDLWMVLFHPPKKKVHWWIGNVATTWSQAGSSIQSHHKYVREFFMLIVCLKSDLILKSVFYNQMLQKYQTIIFSLKQEGITISLYSHSSNPYGMSWVRL